MLWSDAALKGTLGSGGISALVYLIEPLDPWIGFWVLFVLSMTPFLLFLFVKLGELPNRVVKLVHIIAVIWYLALAIAALGMVISNGPRLVDFLFFFFIGLGLIPCFVTLKAIRDGLYD